MSNNGLEQKKWTVMIYMAGDNNLSIDMVYSLKEIRESVNQKNHEINLLVYYDGNTADMPTLYCDFTDFNNPVYTPVSKTKRRDVARGRNPNTLQQDESSAEMYSLTNFVDWCVSDKDDKRGRKADRYALIVSGHGSGFQNLSFLKDDESNYYMTLEKFRAALNRMKNNTLGQKIDVLGFDNCVMSMLEIGNEIHDLAGVMVASEGSIPNAGWAYGDILNDLLSGQVTGDSKELGKTFVKKFIERQKDYAIGGVAVDISAWDLDKVKNVTNKVDSLGEILYRSFQTPAIRNQLELVLLQAHYKCQSFMFEQNIDLKDFCQLLSESSVFLSDDLSIRLEDTQFQLNNELVKRCKAVSDAVDECILLSGFSGGAYQYSNGIAIFFPWTYLTYRLLKEDYEKLNFAKTEAKNWNNFLELYLGAITLRELKPGVGINESVNFAGASKETEQTQKIIEESVKVINNAANRVINNAANRVINNAANRVINNAANRLLGTSGFISADFKNMAMPWYITDFTKEKTQDVITEDSSDTSAET